MLRLNVCLTLALIGAVPCAMVAQPRRHVGPAPQEKVQIVLSTSQNSSIDITEDHWIASGYDLRSLIAEIYEIDSRRIDLPENAVTAARYDVVASFPDDADEAHMQRLLQKALEDKFQLAITPEHRAMNVYVITAPAGPGPALHEHRPLSQAPPAKDISGELQFDDEDQQRFTYRARICPGISSGGIKASAGTISEFRRTLEPNLDRPVVNETDLAGAYDFEIGEFRSREELFQLLQKELGLVVIPTQREIVVLTVRLSSSNS